MQQVYMRLRIQVILDKLPLKIKRLQQEKSQSKTLKLWQNQSEDITLAKEFVSQKVDPPTWTQSSQNSI